MSGKPQIPKYSVMIPPPRTPNDSVGNLTPVGRLKEAPNCLESHRKENMDAKSLSEFCFSVQDVFPSTAGSETEANEKVGGDYSSLPHDVTGKEKNGTENMEDKLPCSPKDWSSFKEGILKRTESRSGRDHQRFANDPQTGHLLRLTTGTVPIMKGGRILLISSSQKEEWILPKGGWESDESLEISALREAYEEGGIVGVLGPNLESVEYETRKAKKRRLGLEMKKKNIESINAVGGSAVISNGSTQSENSSICLLDEDEQSPTPQSLAQNKMESPTKECLATKIRDELQGRGTKRIDDCSSIASSDGSSSCAHIRMKMIALYVLEVKESWPESGRARKVVDIDTAIELMATRPEFQKVLIEVKEKGYHLNVHNREKENIARNDVASDSTI